MYYDDDARRFNFMSGLVLGAVLGTGIALILGPPRRLRGKPRRMVHRVARTADRARRRARSGWSARQRRTADHSAAPVGAA